MPSAFDFVIALAPMDFLIRSSSSSAHYLFVRSLSRPLWSLLSHHASFPLKNQYFNPVIISLSIMGIIHSSYLILRLHDIKRIIVYSSIIHMNYVVISIYSSNPNSLLGSLLYAITHGIISSSLFILIGTKTQDLWSFGISKILWIFWFLQCNAKYSRFCLFISLISNYSFPFTSSFPSEVQKLRFRHLWS